MELASQNENGLFNEQLVLTAESVGYLQKIASWTTYFSILGFVFIGLMLVFGIVVTTFMSAIFATAGQPFMAYLGFIYIVIALIYFTPVLYLYRFSINTKKAIRANDSNEIMLALKNLKSHFKFVGIFTIVVMSLYIIAGLGFALARLLM